MTYSLNERRVEGYRVAVGVALQGKSGPGINVLGVTKDCALGAFDLMSLVNVARAVEARQQGAARGPAEFVAQHIVRGLGRGQAATVGGEADDLTPLVLEREVRKG